MSSCFLLLSYLLPDISKWFRPIERTLFSCGQKIQPWPSPGTMPYRLGQPAFYRGWRRRWRACSLAWRSNIWAGLQSRYMRKRAHCTWWIQNRRSSVSMKILCHPGDDIWMLSHCNWTFLVIIVICSVCHGAKNSFPIQHHVIYTTFTNVPCMIIVHVKPFFTPVI